ncbi:bifunctional phosphopantothenoylcysteine decarboxylase/phosphopantothenate--cysteine ligase CoaBC [Streptomyces smyrnaeus]|uniref:bifunctional phosphopantothenoylcysteine decarboxylase/phosphopantothenate--cysteine ligase CoaBC n=1 Tax=Streptomyces TaxID=1883 RepID=UPI000C199618|nr:bifunctional phosphopantothenoylcysteine decarboxylase/phosphopantothenate--cysteine ligase CoaBC [Streptomyces sp. RK75]MBQ0865562.1 bifunctional phosphopantothenoylcysteine decarboxylase/phosphopantothenate--cysteine ligase CoaBC [Streptomyces sp. RK75]MBQ1159744.1 bifunctional phosphopantothenoylcysteine decarboxylase/phosphopantothenate--cysteine ligase CoaBC [Streptomyces sp. A73]
MTQQRDGRAAAGKPKVVLGVSGGIAAYKACELVRRLTESGHDVRAVPTESALHFVGAATFSALTGHPVATDVWESVHEVPHVRIGQGADLVVVAPATADLLAKAAHGLADDLLTNTLLTARCPVVFAPAMHTEMWEHPATQQNVATLRSRGALVIEPAVGRLTGKDTGKGRLPDPDAIFDVCRRVLLRGAAGTAPDLAGRHVVVSAGGTREPLDPVRFLGNRSSGKQGYALARVAAARGARVTLVSANSALPDPAGVDVVRVGSAIELREAVTKAAADADAVVMAAAVADFRPAVYATGKIKKKGDQEPEPLTLVRNPDILAEISASRPRPGQIVAGFAAETDEALAHGRAKLATKGCDLLVVNEVGESKTFGAEENEAVVLGADGSETPVPYGPKEMLAETVWDLIAERLPELPEE